MALEEREVVAGLHMSRSLEHQMLEEMGEALPVRLFVTRPDVVPEVDSYDPETWRRAHHDP